MRTLYLDCGMGAAGDMLTASLLQLFSEPVKQVKKLNDLKIPGVKYQLVACTRGGIRGYQVRVFVKGQEEENPHMQTKLEDTFGVNMLAVADGRADRT